MKDSESNNRRKASHNDDQAPRNNKDFQNENEQPASYLTKILQKVSFYFIQIKKHPKSKSTFSLTLSIFLIAYIRSRRSRSIRSIQHKSTKPLPFYSIPIISYLLGTAKSMNTDRVSLGPSRDTTEEVPLSFLFTALQNKEIQKAFLNSCTCIFTLRNSHNNKASDASNVKQTEITEPNMIWKKVTFPESKDMREKLLSKLSSTGCDQISTLTREKNVASYIQEGLIYAIPFIYLAMVYKMLQKFQNDPYADHDSPLSRQASSLTSKISFKDVAGITSAKLELREVVQCLSKPSIYKKIGARVPKGVLLYGPPGAGKTLLARAVAGEAGTNCVFIACSGGDFVEVLVGRGAARVRDLFSRARREALATIAKNQTNSWISNIISSTPTSSNPSHASPQASAVIFIDEIDALAKSRVGASGGSSFGGGCDEREQTLNQLLTEMDGFHSSNQHVTIVVFAATNRPDVLDPALLRPGRFDRHVHVGLPDRDGREAILKLHATKIQLAKEGTLNGINWKHVVKDKFMNDFSGADIENVVNEAAFLAVRKNDVLVGQNHLMEATEKIAKMKLSGLHHVL